MSGEELLDLDRCSFLRGVRAEADADADGARLACWSEAEPREIEPDEQRERCLTLAHTSCPALLASIGSRPPDAWSETGEAAQVVAESCFLAQARLEVRAEQLGLGLSRIFGPGF